jgi:hypothetical protein
MSEIEETGTVEWFRKFFWTINPVSNNNVESAYFYASQCIGAQLPDGSTLFWEELLKRYTDYYNYIFPLQNGKYTKKENTLKSIEDYCYEKMYISNYSKNMENGCDAYLFGI